MTKKTGTSPSSPSSSSSSSESPSTTTNPNPNISATPVPSARQSSLRSKRSTDAFLPQGVSSGHSRKNSLQEDFARARSYYGPSPTTTLTPCAPSTTREIPSILPRRSRSPSSMSPAAPYRGPAARRNSSSSSTTFATSSLRTHTSTGVGSVTTPGPSWTLPPLQSNPRNSGQVTPTTANYSPTNIPIDIDADSVTAITITTTSAPLPSLAQSSTPSLQQQQQHNNHHHHHHQSPQSPTPTPSSSSSITITNDNATTNENNANINGINGSFNNSNGINGNIDRNAVCGEFANEDSNNNNGSDDVGNDEEGEVGCESDGGSTYVLHLKCNELRADRTSLGVVVVYIIQVTQGMSSSLWEVARRFNQFYFLDLDLRVNFPDEHLPKLPSRYIFKSRTDPSIIKERARLLQTYLDEISRNPAITASDFFKDFIDPKNVPDLYPLSNPSISGVLTKTRSVLRTTYSTFVAVVTPLLVYYDSVAPKPLESPKKILDLAYATVKLDKSGPSFVVTLKSGYLAKFSSKDRALVEKWVMMIRKAIDDATPKEAEGKDAKKPQGAKTDDKKVDPKQKQQQKQQTNSKQVDEKQEKQQKKVDSKQIIQPHSSVSSTVGTKDRMTQQQQQQQQQHDQLGVRRTPSGNKISRSMSVTAIGFNAKALTLTSDPALGGPKMNSPRQASHNHRNSADFAAIIKNVKQKTDSKLRSIINSLQSTSSSSTTSSAAPSPLITNIATTTTIMPSPLSSSLAPPTPTTTVITTNIHAPPSPVANLMLSTTGIGTSGCSSGPSTPRISAELANKLIEVATRIISADPEELMKKQTCRDCIYELQDLEKQERHHAIRFMIHDISELSRVLEAKRGHDRSERSSFRNAKQRSTNELPFFALPGKFDDSITSKTTASSSTTLSSTSMPTMTRKSPAIDMFPRKSPKDGNNGVYLISKTPTDMSTINTLGDSKDSDDENENETDTSDDKRGLLIPVRRGNSIDICNDDENEAGSLVSSFPSEKFIHNTILGDGNEENETSTTTTTTTTRRSGNASNNSSNNDSYSGSRFGSKNGSMSDLQQVSEAGVGRFVGPSELEHISSVVGNKRSPDEIVVCRICDESFPRYLLNEHTDYCISAVTLAMQDTSSDMRILDIAAAIEEKRDMLTGIEGFDSTPYTKLVLVSRDIASLKCGSEELTRRCRRFLKDLQSYLTNNDLDLFLLAYGHALCSVLEEKYAVMSKVLQIQQENETRQQKRSIWSFIPFMKPHKGYNTSGSAASSTAGDDDDDSDSSSSSSDDDDGTFAAAAAARRRVSIEDFTFIKKISSGAYGRVFLARKNTTHDLYAVKMLLKEDTIRKNMIESVNAERKILSSVSNPFVVNLYYAFQDERYLYLVMEYCPGGDVGTLLKNLGSFNLEMTRTYAAEIVLALESLHSLNYIHRDLKPDNLLVGATGHIVLADFGLSSIGVMMDQVDADKPKDKGQRPKKGQQQQQHGHHSPLSAAASLSPKGAAAASAGGSLSNPSSPGNGGGASASPPQALGERGRIVGTPDYLAPEVLMGLEHGPEVDWWALGVIVFEFLTSVPPFNGDSPDEIFDNILDMRIPWPPISDEVGEEGECLGFPTVAHDFVEKLLVKDPAKRLGHNGAAEVKAHPFFAGIDWENLVNEPRDDIFVPVLDDPEDTSYFEDHGSVNQGMTDDNPPAEPDLLRGTISINPPPPPPPAVAQPASDSGAGISASACTPTTIPTITGVSVGSVGNPGICSRTPSPLSSLLSTPATATIPGGTATTIITSSTSSTTHSSPLAVANSPVVVDADQMAGFTLQGQGQGQGGHGQSSPLAVPAPGSPVGAVAAGNGVATPFMPQLNDAGAGSADGHSARKEKKKKKGNDFRNFEFVNTNLIKKKNLDIVNGGAAPMSSPSLSSPMTSSSSSSSNTASFSSLSMTAGPALGSPSGSSSSSSGGSVASSLSNSSSSSRMTLALGLGGRPSPSTSPALYQTGCAGNGSAGSNPIGNTTTTFDKSPDGSGSGDIGEENEEEVVVVDGKKVGK